jgi:hypothetical protein
MTSVTKSSSRKPFPADLEQLALHILSVQEDAGPGDEYVAVIVDQTCPFWHSFAENPPTQNTGYLARRSFMVDVFKDIGESDDGLLAAPSPSGNGLSVVWTKGYQGIHQHVLSAGIDGGDGFLTKAKYVRPHRAFLSKNEEELHLYWEAFCPTLKNPVLVLTVHKDPIGTALGEFAKGYAPVQIDSRTKTAIFAVEKTIALEVLAMNACDDVLIRQVQTLPLGAPAVLIASDGVSAWFPGTILSAQSPRPARHLQVIEGGKTPTQRGSN